jgi:DNA repair exonuclease SbcCD ATPase subunit
MNKKFIKNILILLLASTLVFGVFRYVSYLKENIRDLESQKQNLESQKQNLESQKQNLLQELEKEKNTVEKLKLKNNSLKSNLQAVHKRLDRSFLDLKLSEKRFEELNSRISVLKAENLAFSEDKIKLTEENEVFKSTLTSIPELKAAIQELKRLARFTGNRGFLIKGGQSIPATRVKIEVVPAPGK